MVSLAELLVVMTNRLKIVRIIHARNVHCVHGHKRLDDDARLSRLSLQESGSVVFSVYWGVVLLFWDNRCMSGSGF